MKFSRIEKEHLLKAWIATSLAFAILLGGAFSFNFIIYFIISLVTVGIGFILHELAHKLVAQSYHCWAEFRADDKMLAIAVISSFFGFVFAAPGAVWIHGIISKDKNGKISAAGPLTNIILSIIFFGLSIMTPQSILTIAFSFGFQINAYVGLFNMIPFMNMDGEKILRWNKIIYILMVVSSGILVFLPHLLPAA